MFSDEQKPSHTAAAALGAADPAELGRATRVMVVLPAANRSRWAEHTRQLELAYHMRLEHAWRMRSLGVRCLVFDLPPGRTAEQLVERLAGDPRVEAAQPVYAFEVLAVGRDPYSGLQHGTRSLRVEPAHRWATGKGVRGAVIDTGVDVDHPDRAGRVAKAGNFAGGRAADFRRDIHGTAVAGLVAADAGNRLGIAGVAPDAELMALKACRQLAPDRPEATCDSYSLATAFDFALAEGAQVINLSLTGPRDPLLARLIATAIDRGVTVVAAAADQGPPGFPASMPEVLGVRRDGGGAAPDPPPATGRPAPRSTAGTVPASPETPSSRSGGRAVPAADSRSPGTAVTASGPLGAPGVDILTTVPGGGYDFFSGSSMAAAQVSGVVALLLERRPDLGPRGVARLLRETARAPSPTPAATGAPATPADPQVDACAALTALLGHGACDEPEAVSR
jgi:subtilisin family serine protease